MNARRPRFSTAVFGDGASVLLAVACIASYVVISERGIYGTQRVDTPRDRALPRARDRDAHALAQQRRHWLPAPSRRVVDDEAVT